MNETRCVRGREVGMAIGAGTGLSDCTGSKAIRRVRLPLS